MKYKDAALLWMRRVLISGLVFFAVTMPFKYYLSLINVTEIRPAAALPPFFGMVYGIPGALGCALANFVADLMSGYTWSMSLVSFPVQLLMGLLPYFLWYHIPEPDGRKPGFPQMDTTAHVIKYLLIIVFNSAVITLLLGLVLNNFGVAKVFSQVTLVMFWNNLDFGYMLGLPLFTLTAVRNRHRFSLNERLILIFLLLAILCATLTGMAVWEHAHMLFYDRVQLWSRVYTDMALTLNVVTFVELAFLIYIEKRITVPIQTLARAADSYVQADVEKLDSQQFIHVCRQFVDYRMYRMEVGDLARSYTKMVSDLDIYMENLKAITAEKERIDAELNVAAQIQADMLPDSEPLMRGRDEFEISAMMIPAKEVGGDFYDFFMVDSGHLALVMADVSGKGVPAAMFMVIAKTLLKNAVQTGLSPKAALEKVNNQLCENNDAEMFVTVWLGILEVSTGRMLCANAGHEYPAVRRAGGTFELFQDKHGFVLAGMENTKYREYELTLHSGDALFVYTDGVAEATDANNQLYGTQRMLDALNQPQTSNCQQLLGSVQADINQFMGDAPQFDDITMLAIKIREAGQSHRQTLELPAELSGTERAIAFFENFLSEHDVSPNVITRVNVAVDEIFSNIARYSGATSVTLECEVVGRTVWIQFSDNGRPYDPTQKPDPDISASAEEREIGGLGIFLVKRTMDHVSYGYKDGFNILTLKKTW